MTSDGPPLPDAVSGIDPLWDELARDQRELAGLGPVVRHLVRGESNPLLGEEPIARTRAMIETLALELLRPLGEPPVSTRQDSLAAALVDAPGVLAHVHALAMEGQIVARLAEQGIDPLLPPLVQDRISASDPQLAGLAMTLMAAQTRFVRRYQRMELAAADLPADLFDTALSALADQTGAAGAEAVAAWRAGFDERRGRLGLLAQLGLGLGDDFAAALDPAQAGVSLFVTAVSLLTGQDRDHVVLAAANARPLRLALLLAMAGLEPAAREAVILRLHPTASLQPHWFAVDSHHAADLLAQGLDG